MIRNHLKNVQSHLLHGEQKGQSIIIVTFAFLGLIAMLGVALDVGLVYIERVRVSRTTDAATLAGVVELPFEEEAMKRAIEFIELNGYQVGQDTEIRVRGCIDDGGNLVNVSEDGKGADGDKVDADADSAIAGYTLIPSIEPARAVFVIDTLGYQPVDRDASGDVETENQANCTGTSGETTALYGTANKVRVSGEVTVDMNFMQFFGFGEVPVQGVAVGENVTNLDVAVVFDVSGSMYFETNCFGCWKEDEDLSDEIMKYPYPSNGEFFPLNLDGKDVYWEGGSAGDLCEMAPASIPGADGYKYFVHEAEFYSRDVPLHGWEFDQRNPGQGFWVLHRDGKDASNDAHIRAHPFPTYSQGNVTNYPQLLGGSYNAECFDGPNLSGQCWKDKASKLGEAAPSNVPYVEYDFTPDWTGDTHVWIRAVGGTNHSFEWNGRSPTNLDAWRESVYWQINNNNVRGGPFNRLTNTNTEWTFVPNGSWRWVYLGSETTTNGAPSVFRLYQGSSGFNVDKILFTNNDTADTVGMVVYYDGSKMVDSGGSVNAGLKSILGNDKGAGPDATPGSATREACNLCNPAFGVNPVADPSECSCRKNPGDTTVGVYPGGGTGIGCTSLITPTNQLEDDLFHGIDPIRSAQEAVKNFAKRLDPKFDQLGIVAYSNNIKGRIKLQCRQWSQKHDTTNGVRGCFATTNPLSYTNVIQNVEDYKPGGSTNIAEGMREGLEELGISIPTYNPNVQSGECDGTISANNKEPCDRRGAARRVLILMTDGSPNQDVSCPGGYKWRGEFGGGRPYDCAMYFAQQAADNNVTVYTIGIGAGVNIELLTAMATGKDPNPKAGDDGFYFEGRGGQFYHAVQPNDLDAIFEDILSNIYVRIIG